MRLKFAALIAALLTLLLVPTAAQAQGLDFSFTAANQSGASGATLRYAGTVTNTSGVTLYLTFDSLTLLDNAAGNADDSVFFNAVTVPYLNGSPATLLNNATFTLPVFDVTLSPGAAPGATISGTFLLSADDSPNPAAPGRQYSTVSEPPLLKGDFTATVLSGVAPEPASVLLLTAGILALCGTRLPVRPRGRGPVIRGSLK